VDKDSQKHNRVVTVSGPKDAVETALALLTARLETTRRKDIPVTWHNTPPAVEAPQRSSVLAGGAEAIDRDGGTDTDTDEDSTDYELDDDDDALHICDVALSAAAAIDAHGWVVSAHDWMIAAGLHPLAGSMLQVMTSRVALGEHGKALQIYAYLTRTKARFAVLPHPDKAGILQQVMVAATRNHQPALVLESYRMLEHLALTPYVPSELQGQVYVDMLSALIAKGQTTQAVEFVERERQGRRDLARILRDRPSEGTRVYNLIMEASNERGDWKKTLEFYEAFEVQGYIRDDDTYFHVIRAQHRLHLSPKQSLWWLDDLAESRKDMLAGRNKTHWICMACHHMTVLEETHCRHCDAERQAYPSLDTDRDPAATSFGFVPARIIDEVLWACAHPRYADKCLQLFQRMQNAGIRPTHRTCFCVMTAMTYEQPERAIRFFLDICKHPDIDFLNPENEHVLGAFNRILHMCMCRHGFAEDFGDILMVATESAGLTLDIRSWTLAVELLLEGGAHDQAAHRIFQQALLEWDSTDAKELRPKIVLYDVRGRHVPSYLLLGFDVDLQAMEYLWGGANKRQLETHDIEYGEEPDLITNTFESMRGMMNPAGESTKLTLKDGETLDRRFTPQAVRRHVEGLDTLFFRVGMQAAWRTGKHAAVIATYEQMLQRGVADDKDGSCAILAERAAKEIY
jgi:hypothetical protein